MVSQFFTYFASNCQKGSFFGLRPWWHYLPDESFSTAKGQTCDIKHFKIFPPNSDVPLVLLAVVDDLLRIAALVALGFVIYGAVLYITSEGKPDATARAQSTIINSLIGMAIAIIATAFVSFLGSKLGG